MSDTIIDIRITDIPPEFYQSATRRIIDYLIGIVRITETQHKEDAVLIGSGTLVDINGTLGILTAHHVIDALPSHGNLGFIVSEQLHRPLIEAQALVHIRIAKGSNLSIGPDLGFIKLPHTIIGLLKARRSFYNLSKNRERILHEPPANNLGLWCLSGIPDEKTLTEGPSREFETVKGFLEFCAFGLGISNYHILGGFDYFDFDVFYNERPQSPISFGGMSGGGLWQVLIAQDEKGRVILKESILSGVAFYQSPLVDSKRVIKCHGRESIYNQAYNTVERELS
jgi:hypothetical protein